MFLFFAVTVMLDLHSATEHMLETVEELQSNYPTSVHLMAQKALVLYHMRGTNFCLTVSNLYSADHLRHGQTLRQPKRRLIKFAKLTLFDWTRLRFTPTCYT